MNNSTYDFTQLAKLLQDSGITVEEAAKIFKVSRPTIYAWKDGHPPNQELLLRNTERLIKIIERAVAAKALPILNADKSLRVAKITEVLRKFLNP